MDPEPVPGLRPTLHAKGAPRLFELPHVRQDGYIFTEWELTDEDRVLLLQRRERIRLWIRTDAAAPPPLFLEVTNSEEKW